jgi:biopolymer transport protein ExbD
MPAISSRSAEGLPVVSQKSVDEFMIKVVARQVNGKPVIQVENQVVDLDNLVGALRQWVNDKRKTELLIDAQGVDWGVFVAIQDAAKGADVQRVHLLERTEESK